MEERMAIDHSQQLDHTFGRLPRHLAGVSYGRTWLYSWIRRDGLALIIFTLGALLAVYPILLQPRSRILGWPGDNVQYVFMTGWTAKALQLKQSPLIDPQLNYPDTLVLSATDAPFLSMLGISPATIVFGPTFGYNLIIILSHVLSGYFVYLWILRLTGSRFGGIIAGLAFMLAPYRIVHSYGHLQLVSTQMLPLFFWALDHTLQAPRPSLRQLLWLGGATCLVASMCQYYLVFSLMIGAVYALLTVLPRPAYVLKQGWKLALPIGFGALIGSLPYLIAQQTNAYTSYDINSTSVYSANLLDFVIPSPLQALWGDWSKQHLPGRDFFVEHTLYIGAVTGLLAVVALLARSGKHRRRNLVWLAVALCAALLALGTELHISNGVIFHAAHPIRLPMYYLGQLPVIRLMRTWSRFGVLTLLFASLLAGIGAARVMQGLNGWYRRAVAVGITALLLIDLLPGHLQTSILKPRPVDLWLAEQPGDFAVAFLPTGNDIDDYIAMFGSLFHTKRFPAFNHPTHKPEAYRKFEEVAAVFPDPRSIEALRQMKLRYLLLSRQAFDGTDRPAWVTVETSVSHNPHLRIVAHLDDYDVVA